jgi:Ca2+-binding EF-hand superfamily protein
MLVRKRLNPEGVNLTKRTERNMEQDFKNYTAREITDILKKVYVDSGVDCMKQVNKVIESQDGSDLISSTRFRNIIYEDLKFGGLTKTFIEQLFEKLDPKKLDKVSMNNLPILVYKDSETAEKLLTLPEKGDELYLLASEASNSHYPSSARFAQACRHAHQNEITKKEFGNFIQSFTRLTNKHTDILFKFIDSANQDTLREGQLLTLYEYSQNLQKEKLDKLAAEKSKQEERINSLLNLSREVLPGFDDFPMVGFGDDGFGNTDRIGGPGAGGGLDDIQAQDEMHESSLQMQGREPIDEVEELAMQIGIKAMNLVRNLGVVLKPFYKTYADKVSSMMKFDEFKEAVTFILKGEIDLHEAEPNLKRLFSLLAWPSSKMFSFSSFRTVIEMGKKINPIYIKLKRRYADKLKEVKGKFEDELMKLSVKRDDGYASLYELKKLFKHHGIEITNVDTEVLVDEGMVVQKDKNSMIELKPFIERVFQEHSAFSLYIQTRAVQKIVRKYRRYKVRKLEMEQRDKAVDHFLGAMGLDESKQRQKSPKGKPKYAKKPKPVKSPEERMMSLFPAESGRSPSNILTVQQQKIISIVETLLKEIMDDAVNKGEINLLKKTVQRRFANRSVNKDSVVVIQEESFAVSNVLPRSVSGIPSIGRLFYMSNEALLNQFDITNNQMLPSVDLSSKIPMKKDEMLDYLLDQENGTLYVLKMSWILEAWNIFQKSRTPSAKVKLVQFSETATVMQHVYKQRYLGTFPQILSMSQSSGQFLIVNCTMVNETIFFLDPISLSLLDQAKPKSEDLNISPQLNKIFYQLKPLFGGISQSQNSFDRVFGSNLKSSGKVKYVPIERFYKYFLEDAPQRLISETECRELVQFLNLNGDETVDEEEWQFLADNVRLTMKKSNVHASYEIPEELKDIDRNVAKIFYDMYDFVQKRNISIEELFKIFDGNNSGSVSEAEFMNIIGEISKETEKENKMKFFRFVDKNNSRTIEIDEFCSLFRMFGKYSPQELLPSESPRHDFFLILEKAFDYGIDLEQEFLKHDDQKDGGIPVHKFTTLMKSLPLGITENDVNYFIDKVLHFTNDGSINYMEIFSDERYKRIKYIYQIKKGFSEYESKMKTSEDIDRYLGLPKIVIESVIHLSAENIFIYTTVSPKTSTIYAARLRDDKLRDKHLAEGLFSQLLAKLVGHKSKEPPCILFVNESNCLISGEKLPPWKESMSETMANSHTKNTENFSRFYSNITNNKARVANILIWNLGRDLFNDSKLNPPWKISPARIIENAHYDSVISLAYMPLSQIIVSTSIDGSVKLWDPIARPHSLVHQDSTQKTGPGSYIKPAEEHTTSNQTFSEVRRFYTGELTCYSLVCLYQRIPVPDTDGVPRFRTLEYLATLELGKAQRSAGKLRTEGVIKLFGVERISIDVPVSRFEETVPKQLWNEIVDLAISNRQATKFLFKKNLATNLDKLMSKVVIQKTEVSKIPKLLKSITLERYAQGQNIDLKKELFNLLIHLPMRNPDINPKMLSIDEVHMHLRRNNFIYPSNLSKEAFVRVVQEIIEKSSHYLVDQRSKNQNRFVNLLSQMISKKELDLDALFNKEFYTRNEFKRILDRLGGKDDEVEDLLASLDPFYSDSIKLETIKMYFSSEIINAKIGEFARPNYIISHINAKLSRSNKVELLRNLFSSDPQGSGKVTMLAFLQSFAKLSRTIDENLLKELFELLSESRDHEDPLLDLSYFCKKLLTHSEQFELARVYNALGKIKNALRYRLKSLEDLFMNEEADFKGKSIQNLTIKVADFMSRIKDLDIVGLTPRDLSLIGSFLSTVDEDGTTCISLINLNAYFKKIELKYQFTELADYKLMVRELKKILLVKEEFARKWAGVCHREIIGFAEMRVLLNHFNVSEDVIDLVLLKFVENDTSSVNFFNKIQAFVEMNSFLDDSKNMKASNVTAIAKKLFDDEKVKQVEEQKQADRPRDSIDDLIDLMEKHETKKSIMAALNVCKRFDSESTGRVTVPDFVNILTYNLEMTKYPEAESVLLAFQNEMIIKNNLKTLEYSEIFDRLESRRATKFTKANTEQNIPLDPKENEASLTKVITQVCDVLRSGKFKLHGALAYFDKDSVGLILPENFKKILDWATIKLNEEEMAILEDNLLVENAINYRKFLDLIDINDKHINVQFDPEIWYAISKNFTIELFENLNPHLEALRYYHKIKKDSNPLTSAAVLGQVLREMGREFTDKDIDLILKYAVIGSSNNLAAALNKLERTGLSWEFEYVHMPHFLSSVPIVLNRKRELPENKDTARRTMLFLPGNKEDYTRIISKVKTMLKERGVTMWETIFSSSSDYIEQSKISKYNFLRMLKTIDLDLTLKEKVLLVKALDPQDTNWIDLLVITEMFKTDGSQDSEGVQEKTTMEKLIYSIYYNGHDLDTAFDYIDKEKIKSVSKKDFGIGLSNLVADLSMFEINYILNFLGLHDSWSIIRKGEFKKKIKRLMKKYDINPTNYISSSLFPQIKNLIDKKQKHLRECFEELDLHKSGYADVDMLTKALTRFGLTNLKKSQVKTLVKLFTKDVNLAEGESDLEAEDEKNNTMSLDLDDEKPKKDDKKNKTLDIEDPNFRIDYNEFVRCVYDEIENNSNLMLNQSKLIFKKVQNLFKIKGFTIFETYVLFDLNNHNNISNVQLTVGMQNMNSNSQPLEKNEMKIFWDTFGKNKENKVTFSDFFNAFINVGTIDIIKFDEKVVKLLKKFCFLISKKGNLEEVFNKFDVNVNGSVKLDEFKQQCEKLNLDFKEDELAEIFRTFCSPELVNPSLSKKQKSMDDGENEDGANFASHRAFNFKNFVAVVSFFRKKDNMYKLLHRFDSMLKERSLSFIKIFDDYWTAHKEKKGSAAAKPKNAKNVVKSINMVELKVLLKDLKLSFTADELNLVCDAFEVETITAKQMETIIRGVSDNIEKEKNEKHTFYSRVVKEIEEGIQQKNSNLQKIFFEYDARSDGRLKLDELNDMLKFLQVRVNKTEAKMIFEEMDFDKKGTVTIKEFQSFLDQVQFNKQKKEDGADLTSKANSELEPILKKLQDAAIQKQTSLERVIHSQGVDLNQIASVKAIEKAFKDMGCVLKREEVKIIIERASKEDSCSWGDLLDWGIKNNIDFRTKEKAYSQFPPAVQVILSKMLQIFKKMNLTIETAFKYFVKDFGDRTMRNDFLTIVQGLQIQTSEEELIGLYNFFDERNYGEISKSSFIEKCEIARDFYKWSDSFSDGKQKKGLTTLTLRQHVISILEKYYVSFLEKNYNKKQIFAVFDKHGNGIITRNEFLTICENLGMPIPQDYHGSLMNFIDPTESQNISVTALINKMEESVPDHAKDTLKNSQGQTILRDIVGKLKVHYKSFITEYLDLEKKLQLNDIFSRSKTGVSMYDFYRLLASYGIRLQEGDKMILNAAFKNKSQPEYFDTEMLYESFDKIHKESGLLSDIEAENLEVWESNILRRVADRLRSMNLSLDKAFSNIQNSSNLGFIKIVDFKQLLFSLDINLSQKDVDLLIKRLATSSNPNVINMEEFKQRFWACFFEGKAQLNPLNIELRSRQIASMLNHKIRFEMKMPLSVSWDRLDKRRIGVATIEDLKDFMIEIKMPITKEDLGSLFSLIDQNEDNLIDQFEFMQFWEHNFAADFESKKKKQKNLEAEVLGRIVKVLNQADIDLLKILRQRESTKGDYLDERQFNTFLSKMGLNIEESKVRGIMSMLNNGNSDRISLNQLETALLRNGLKARERKNETKVDFNDTLLVTFLNALNITANKMKVKVKDLVKEFDEDYDGYLSVNEFYNLVRSLEKPFKMSEIQRLAHNFGSTTSINKIYIDKIVQAQIDQDKIEIAVTEDLCDGDAFGAVLENFDPTVMLFRKWSKLTQAKIRFEKYLEINKDKLRGLRLLSIQYKLRQLDEKMSSIHKNTKLIMQYLNNTSTQIIKDETLVRWIDPALCSLAMNKKELQNIVSKQDGYMVNEYSSSQQFNLKHDTVTQFNKFISVFKGDVLAEGGKEAWVKVYTSETLKRISKDGKYFEDHLMYTIKLQTLLQHQYPDMFCRMYGYYSRKVGVDPKDRDIYVFYEVLGSEWVSLREFITSTGGLVRIPFLVTSNSIFHVVKYWFQKILAIVDICNQNAICLYLLRPENLYVNHKTLEMKLATLSGAARINYEGTLSNLTDLNIVLPNLGKADDTIYFKEESYSYDPYLAPEFFYAVSLFDLRTLQSVVLTLTAGRWVPCFISSSLEKTQSASGMRCPAIRKLRTRKNPATITAMISSQKILSMKY